MLRSSLKPPFFNEEFQLKFQADKIIKHPFVAIGAVASALIALLLGLVLINGVDSRDALIFFYLGFALFVIVTVHFSVFSIPILTGTPLSKRSPKYLEYAYIILISISLADVITVAPRYYLYLTQIGEDESSLLSKISDLAQLQVTENCGKEPKLEIYASATYTSNYTEDYCAKLTSLIDAKNNKAVVLQAYKDDEFMNFVVGYFVSSDPNEQQRLSKLRNYKIIAPIRRVAILTTFRQYEGVEETKGIEAIMKLLSLLLLPLGIGLRVAKTSLELFGELK